uniref:Acetyltransferase n=1 Tax=Sphingobacterium sp. (strain 21) TaxID=743722 RepID=F4C957_SPHS2
MSSFIKKLKIKLSFKRWLTRRNIIGHKVKIGEGTKLRDVLLSGEIVIGKNCKLKSVEIDGRVSIGNYTTIWGPNTDLQAAVNKIVVGNFCSIGRNVTFQEFNHNYERFTTFFINQNLLGNDRHREEIVSKGDIVIEHDVWIGTHCVILSGAHISTGAVVAANSVVSGFVPPYAIVGGSPARVLKYRFDESKINKLLETKWWDWEEEKIKNNIEYLKNL